MARVVAAEQTFATEDLKQDRARIVKTAQEIIAASEESKTEIAALKARVEQLNSKTNMTSAEGWTDCNSTPQSGGE